MTFTEWLKSRYRDSSQKTILQQVNRARRAHDDGVSIPNGTLGGLRSWVKYVENEQPKLSPKDTKLLAIVKNELKKDRTVDRRGPRKLEARSFTPDDLAALAKQIISDTTPEGMVLHVLLDTGLRIGDILRLPTKAIRDGLREGLLDAEVKGGYITQIPIAGARETWWRLYRALKASKQSTVARFICPNGSGSPEAGGGAYQRVNRKFKELGERVGVHGRVHLHRLRRSFAIDALRQSKDITAVQQALGHRSITSTQKYLDEVRVGDVAKIQIAVRENRKKRK